MRDEERYWVAHYLDTSALVKLVVLEAESTALIDWLRDESNVAVTSDLSRTELHRAVRKSAPERAIQARQVLDSMTILTVTSQTFEAAGRLEPLNLRSLDAIHLAAALELGDDLAGLVTYDERLAEGARMHGITVVAPAEWERMAEPTPLPLVPGAPARRALEAAGIRSLEDLARMTLDEVHDMHGIGPKAFAVLAEAMIAAGLQHGS
jgi:uncharacterized protein